MNRRDTIKGLAAVAGIGLVPASVLAEFLGATAAAARGEATWKPKLVPTRHAALLAELVDTVIPRTDTPGAKDALVHVFVDLYAADVYPKPQQDAFLAGLDMLARPAGADRGKPFLDLAADERLALLVALEKASLAQGEPVEQSFVRSLKNTTLLGYFSSKPGVTRATGYVRSPGPFRGCVDVAKDQKADALS
jgi:hypothetical protein